jgi:hypothetical protein
MEGVGGIGVEVQDWVGMEVGGGGGRAEMKREIRMEVKEWEEMEGRRRDGSKRVGRDGGKNEGWK